MLCVEENHKKNKCILNVKGLDIDGRDSTKKPKLYFHCGPSMKSGGKWRGKIEIYLPDFFKNAYLMSPKLYFLQCTQRVTHHGNN